MVGLSIVGGTPPIFDPSGYRIVFPNLVACYTKCRRGLRGCDSKNINQRNVSLAVYGFKLNSKRDGGTSRRGCNRLIADNGQKRKTPRKGGVSNVVNCSVSAENSRKRSPSERTERRLY